MVRPARGGEAGARRVLSDPLLLGVIVNPVAGLGGRVGLKGTDGSEVVLRALALGARPEAPDRMAMALSMLSPGLPVLAAPGAMGEEEARAAGLVPETLGAAGPGPTTAADTARAARAMADRGVALLLFAGGDGTARDVMAAVGTRVPVLGVPAGVKMQSAVFASSPRAAGLLARRALSGGVPMREREVMDIDEAARREGRVSARLHGVLLCPVAEDLMQGVKVGGGRDEGAALASLAEAVARALPAGVLALLGPGTTMRAVADRLGVAKTLLGVDVARDGRIVAADAGEAAILAVLAEDDPAVIVVSPIGGQGFLFGRGNQPMSPAVLRRVGLGNVLVAATEAKLAGLPGHVLRVDTGDAGLDDRLAGYRRVITGVGTEAVCRVAATPPDGSRTGR
jgi:predicted polyphosphate/ATP-dependent NAD kinase